jgi:acylphosphatase
MDASIQISISGIVQGVGFRYFVKQTADQLGLTGWVRNEPDGTVSAIAEGEESMLKEFVHLIRIGNRLSTVSGVREQAGDWTGDFTDFQIRY